MRILEITTTVGCRNNCLYCPQNIFIKNYLKKSRQRLMNFRTFKTCIDKIPKDVRISFGGMSEPFQNPACLEMISYVKKNGYLVHIFTTTVGMTVKDIRQLLTLLSFQNPSSHDRLFIHLPSSPKIESITIDKKYLEKINFIIGSLHPDSRIFFHYHGKKINHDLSKLPFGRRLQFRPCHDRAQNPTAYTKKGKRQLGTISCGLYLEENNLQPNGDVTLCCQDFGMKHVLGNLLTQNYASLFIGEEFIKIKKGLMDEKSDILCRYCHFAVNKNLKAFLLNSTLINKFLKK